MYQFKNYNTKQSFTFATKNDFLTHVTTLCQMENLTLPVKIYAMCEAPGIPDGQGELWDGIAISTPTQERAHLLGYYRYYPCK